MRITQWAKVDARWYLGVHCRKCKTPILFALDHSDGTDIPAKAGKLLLTCGEPECGHVADYTGARVERFKKPPPAQNKKGRQS